MANKKHLAILKQGEGAWNQWRHEQPKIRPDLKKANLSHADLRGVNLIEADLSHANLNGAFLLWTDLSKTIFSWADLSEATLFEANLWGANLSRANLSGAKLGGANLSAANLSYANLREVDLSEANLVEANLSYATLSGANLSRTNLSGADLNGTNLWGANLSYANLSGADLSEAGLGRTILIGTDLADAKLRGCRIYGISVWDVKLRGTEQQNLIITPEGQPSIAVDDLEVAQFIYLVLNHQKLRNVFNAVTERGVLLLGRFGGGGLEVLQAIATKLREAKYLPIIFDFERPQDRDFTETVKTLAGLSRFIIADLSGPSVPKELEAIVPHYKIPFAFISQVNAQPFAMSVDLFGFPWVLQPALLFSTAEDLLAKLPTRVVGPAEEMVEKMRRAKEKTLDELFSSE